MKRFFVVAALAALTACAAQPNVMPATNAASPTATNAASPIGAAQHATMPSLGHLFQAGVTSQDVQPHTSVAIQSIVIIATINGKKEKGYVPVKCRATDQGGVATGCGIKATARLVIKNLIAGLLTGPRGTGCIAAVGKWAGGTVQPGSLIPITFYWTGKCG
jgi:hypothetical protein